MKFRRSAPPVLIAAIIAVIAVLTVLSASLFDKTVEATEQSQFELMRSIWTFNLKGAEGRALARAEMIADLPSVRKLFVAKDRAALLAETQAMFKVQNEKHGVDQAQFHLPPALSFLRLHSPDKFGDDLTKFRPMVLAIGQDHQIKKGVAIARSGPAIFGIVPIHDDAQNYVGSFEMGIDFGSVLDGLKAAYGFELAFFVEEAPLKEFAQGADPAIYVDENRLGKYLKFHSTNWALLRELVSSSDLTTNADGIQYNRDAQGVPYGVLLLPVRNNSGTTLGVIALARDFSGTRAAAGRSKIIQGVSALFGMVLLAGLILIVIRGFLLRPLSALADRFAALAAGDTETRSSKDERSCEELQSLTDNHEALRAQSQRSGGHDS